MDAEATDLDRRMREMFADDRLDPVAWPDPVGRIEALVARRRRTWWRRVSACVAALALVGALAVVRLTVLAPVEQPPAPPAVPWLDLPYEEPKYQYPPARPPARPCQPADLVATLDDPEERPPTGAFGADLVIRGRGPGPCTLAGAPHLIATDAETGRRGRLPARVEPVASGGGVQVPATLIGEEAARIIVTSSPDCDGPVRRYRSVSVWIAGREYPVRDLDLESTCPITVTDWHVQRDALPVSEAWLALEVGIEAPSTARLGQTLRYVVTLHNPTGAAVALEPCPTYGHTIVGPDRPYSTSLKLNCAVARIPAGGSVRFAMELTVPATVGTGLGRLEWRLGGYDPGDSRSSEVMITIVP